MCTVSVIDIIYFKYRTEHYENTKLIFKAPASLTIITNTDTVKSKIDVTSLIKGIQSSKEIYKGNVLSYPEYLSASDLWSGSLPRPLFQGSCGSCWAFAISTALSSRFYIESCGISGCQSYPQINFGSLDTVNGNLNALYKFRSVYLADAFKDIDLDKNGIITSDEWSQIIKKYYDIYNSKGTPITERHYIAQILVYILNFQSLGSINLDSWQQVEERGKKAFSIWVKFVESFKNKATKKARAENKTGIDSKIGAGGGTVVAETNTGLNIDDLQNAWANEPITLSAEKIIACCTKCVPLDFKENTDTITNISCEGSTLEDGWTMMKESGTPTAMCIGYNLDNYVDGEPIPSCKEIQGPFYSFCSGYAIDRKTKESPEEWSKSMTKIINTYENNGIEPTTISHSEQNLPWTDPQLFRFRAKNVYKVKNDVTAIQREIMERGPVTAGFVLRKSFQNAFGTAGLGGQKANVDVLPVGPGADSLIYMYDGDPDDSIVGGHAIVIGGWGTYYHSGKDGVIKVPYWICLNSWGSDFGTSGFPPVDNRTTGPSSTIGGGYFWMIRGLNNCAIEDNIYAGQPDLENISYIGVISKYGWGLPSPSKNDVTFLEQRSGDQLKIGPNESLYFGPSLEGGGVYAGRSVTMEGTNTMNTYFLKSMSTPSPYTLFWSDYRPIYCIGTILGELSSMSTDSSIKVDKKTSNVITLVKKVQPNPIFVLGDEQLQLLDRIIETATDSVYGVNRGVNNSDVSKHEAGSMIKIVPYKNLGIPELDKIASKCVQ